MTRLYNDPDDFVDEMIEGFVSANRRWVRKVRGGVVRSTQVPDGQVALVIGGGSGHYPAFSGLVGDGFAHGAAMGNLFASPSAQQIRSVAEHANNGGGVLFSFGNYAGDVLHFGHVQDQLNSNGIPTKTVLVTDDVYSAPIDQRHKRRGIAGDFTVFKIAGAAAAAGLDLDNVARVAEKANERTRSIGVAFSGCKLPGADTPLFEVPEGRMEVGMGIHGESGIDETDVPTAEALGKQLVEAVTNELELPAGVTSTDAGRVAVILNGLGAVKYEELFVVWRTVGALLEERGLTIVEPEVGELVTSFDMAGVSLTLTWLDDELEQFWIASADTPAYRKGAPSSAPQLAEVKTEDDELLVAIPSASPQSRKLAGHIVRVIDACFATVDKNFDMLGQIDAIAGDGDHGIGMRRGLAAGRRAASDADSRNAGAGTTLSLTGDAWSDRAGGTSGAIWGAALEAAGAIVGDEHTPTPTQIVSAVNAATDAVLSFGATVGDKTIVDALLPFRDTITSSIADGLSLGDAWAAATVAARIAADDSAQLLPQIGRARPHAEKSLGTPDPGAVSFALLVETVNTTAFAMATPEATRTKQSQETP